MRICAIVIAAIAIALVAVPADAQLQERTIRWGHLNNTDHPVSFGVQKFAEILAAKSGGKLKVREFPASQLGNEMQMQSALRGGTQELGWNGKQNCIAAPEFLACGDDHNARINRYSGQPWAHALFGKHYSD